jgi:hypothetical protein
MSICLISDGHNVGDAFIRKGIEACLPADATVCVWNKSSDTPLPDADEYILCGMPIIWNEGEAAHWREPWWPTLLALGKRLRCIGVGSCIRLDGTVTDPEQVRATARQLHESCASIIARDFYFNRVTGLDVPVQPCPAFHAFPGGPRGTRLLANLMPNAGHYPVFAPAEAEAWQAKVGDIAKMLIDNGFAAIAHDQTEADFARSLGFTDVLVYDGNLRTFMQVYRECCLWVGNRIHGAIAALGAGADTLCIGLDSRLDAVAVAGGVVRTPTQVDATSIAQWLWGAKI